MDTEKYARRTADNLRLGRQSQILISEVSFVHRPPSTARSLSSVAAGKWAWIWWNTFARDCTGSMA